MSRKGYRAEYLAKKKLTAEYGEENVIKMAIGMASDFLVLKPGSGKLEKIVEVKSTVKDKWYPKPREKVQMKRLLTLAKEHNVRLELWIKRPRKEWEIRVLWEGDNTQ